MSTISKGGEKFWVFVGGGVGADNASDLTPDGTIYYA